VEKESSPLGMGRDRCLSWSPLSASQLGELRRDGPDVRPQRHGFSSPWLFPTLVAFLCLLRSSKLVLVLRLCPFPSPRARSYCSDVTPFFLRPKPDVSSVVRTCGDRTLLDQYALCPSPNGQV